MSECVPRLLQICDFLFNFISITFQILFEIQFSFHSVSDLIYQFLFCFSTIKKHFVFILFSCSFSLSCSFLCQGQKVASSVLMLGAMYVLQDYRRYTHISQVEKVLMDIFIYQRSNKPPPRNPCHTKLLKPFIPFLLVERIICCFNAHCRQFYILSTSYACSYDTGSRILSELQK